jgi:ribose 5-phosphate isomerase B
MKTIAVGCDHGAYELKDKVVKHLTELGYNVIDKGTNGPESVHYPIYAHEVCLAIQNNEAELGILLCSTGIGMSMAANKHKGIRAALCSDTYSARLTRMHNDANVLCIGALVVGQALAIDIVDSFVNASFEGGRHKTRVDMFMALEESEK